MIFEEVAVIFKSTIRNKIAEGKGNHFGLVVDGQCLAVALKYHRDLLGEVAKHCEAVVCCRMSPIQKAEVVPFLISEYTVY